MSYDGILGYEDLNTFLTQTWDSTQKILTNSLNAKNSDDLHCALNIIRHLNSLNLQSKPSWWEANRTEFELLSQAVHAKAEAITAIAQLATAIAQLTLQFSQLDLNNEETARQTLLNYFKTGKIEESKVLIERLQREQPSWWREEKNKASLLLQALRYNQKEIALFLVQQGVPLSITAPISIPDVTNAHQFQLHNCTPIEFLSIPNHTPPCTIDDIVEHIPFDSPSIFRDVNHIKDKFGDTATTLIDHVKSWIVDSGHIPTITESDIPHIVATCGIETLITILRQTDITSFSPAGEKKLIDIALQYKDTSLLRYLIEKGLPVTFEQLITTINKFTREEAIHILNTVSLNTTQTFSLVQKLLRPNTSQAFDLACKLFERIITNHATIPWWNDSVASQLFFTFMDKKSQQATAQAKRLIPHLNGKTTNAYGKSALILALENNFSKSEVETLLAKSSLFHIEGSQKSALQLLIEKKVVPASNQQLKQCFIDCGIPQSQLENISNYTTLIERIETFRNHTSTPLRSKVLLALLLGTKNDVKKLIKNELKATRLNLISDIRKLGDTTLLHKYIDCAVSINPAHYSKRADLEEIPPKNSSMHLQEALLSLYYSSTTEQNLDMRQALEKFATQVENHTVPILPAEDTYSYDLIDRAVCKTIEHLKSQITALETQERPFSALVAARDPAALRLKQQITSFFKEIAEAAGLCGTKFITAALDQYYFLVQGKPRTLENTFLEALTTQRESICQSLIANTVVVNNNTLVQTAQADPQSIHADSLLKQVAGRELGLRGFAQKEKTNDPCTDEHALQAQFAYREFPKHYTPSTITATLADTLSDGTAHEQFLVELGKKEPKWWYDKHVPSIMDALTHNLGITNTEQQLTTSQQDSVRQFLSTNYHVPIFGSDLNTLKTVEAALRGDATLYVENNKQGSTFTPEAIVDALIDMKIFSDRVVPDEELSPPASIAEEKALYNKSYRDSLMKKLHDAEGDLSQLSDLELKQLERAERFITSLDLSNVTASQDLINARVGALTAFFPHIEYLDLQNSFVSQLPAMPASLTSCNLMGCQRLTTIGENVFQACHLEKLFLTNSGLSETKRTALLAQYTPQAPRTTGTLVLPNEILRTITLEILRHDENTGALLQRNAQIIDNRAQLRRNAQIINNLAQLRLQIMQDLLQNPHA